MGPFLFWTQVFVLKDCGFCSIDCCSTRSEINNTMHTLRTKALRVCALVVKIQDTKKYIARTYVCRSQYVSDASPESRTIQYMEFEHVQYIHGLPIYILVSKLAPGKLKEYTKVVPRPGLTCIIWRRSITATRLEYHRVVWLQQYIVSAPKSVQLSHTHITHSPTPSSIVTIDL